MCGGAYVGIDLIPLFSYYVWVASSASRIKRRFAHVYDNIGVFAER